MKRANRTEKYRNIFSEWLKELCKEPDAWNKETNLEYKRRKRHSKNGKKD